MHKVRHSVSLCFGKVFQNLLLLLDGQHAKNLAHALETSLFIAAQQGSNVEGDRVSLQVLDLGVDVLLVVLEPGCDGTVVGVVLGDSGPVF